MRFARPEEGNRRGRQDWGVVKGASRGRDIAENTARAGKSRHQTRHDLGTQGMETRYQKRPTEEKGRQSRNWRSRRDSDSETRLEVGGKLQEEA